MANTITGKIFEIRPTQDIPTKSGQPFCKRELILDCATYDRYTGEKSYDNYPVFTFVQDKCALLDTFQPGQIVTVSFDITGRANTDQATGITKYYNDVRGYKVEYFRQPAETPQPAQPIPAATPQPMPQTMPQQPQANPYGGVPQQYPQYPQQPTAQPQYQQPQAAPQAPQAPQQYPTPEQPTGLPF